KNSGNEPAKAARYFRALPRGGAAPEDRTRLPESVRTAGIGGALGAGDGQVSESRHGEALSGRQHAGQDRRIGRSEVDRLHQDDRPVPHQGKKRGPALTPPDPELRG